jgi:hypothetical protein
MMKLRSSAAAGRGDAERPEHFGPDLLRGVLQLLTELAFDVRHASLLLRDTRGQDASQRI